MNPVSRSVAGAVVLLLGIFLLAGCSPSASGSMIDSSTRAADPTDAPTATSTPTPAPAPTPAVQRPVVAFYGDSITHGEGASVSGNRWSTLVSRAHDWIEVNPSIGGLGFVTNRTRDPIDIVDTIVAARPDIVISTMGLNDNSAIAAPGAAAAVHAAIRADFRRFATELPDARIIIVDPFWYRDERPASVAQISAWVKEEAAAIGADYIPGASHWMDGRPELRGADGLHPNDAGYAMIAAKMNAALAKLGL
ncbi:SGNH/GDSL hydrolase family protein [Leifsonia sp. YIM 134122]|uniref:SGNH/GDSL hydrolase family protein n=1 Tax=Leifsonia stereocauli TaxID=3134136 RepID=A0ABU9W6H1_9MICO